MRIYSTRDILKKIKESDKSYQLTYSLDEGMKFSLRTINGTEKSFKSTPISYSYLYGRNDFPELIKEIEAKLGSGFNANFRVGSVYEYPGETYLRHVEFLSFLLLEKQKDLNEFQKQYIENKLKDPNFYIEGERVFFKETDKKEQNRDFNYAFRYALNTGNDLIFNYLNKDIAEFKDKYLEFISNRKVSFQNFKGFLDCVKINSKKHEDIKNINSIFFTKNFILNFASKGDLSKEQEKIISYVLKEDKKLISKIEEKNDNSIYAANEYTQKESKNVFLLAIHNKNNKLISLLLQNGYRLNEEEKKLVFKHEINSVIPELSHLKIDNSELLLNEIKNAAANKNNIISEILKYSDEDIQTLNTKQEEKRNNVKINTQLLGNSVSPNELQQMFNKNHINEVEWLILSNIPEHLIVLKDKGFDTSKISNQIKVAVIKNLLSKDKEPEYSYKSLMTDLKAPIVEHIKEVTNSFSIAEKCQLLNELFSKIEKGNKKNISLFGDNFIAELIKENKNILGEELVKWYSKNNLTLLHEISSEERKNNFVKEDIEGLVSDYAEVLIKFWDRESFDKTPLLDKIYTFYKEEPTILNGLNKRFYDNKDKANFKEMMIYFEKNILSEQMAGINTEPKNKKRL